MSIELKSCPFCGGKVKEPIRHGEGFKIICHCGLEYSGLCASGEDLARSWNRRREEGK